MIRTYMPNILISAAMEIIKQHPSDGVGSRKLSNKDLKALIELIMIAKEERLPALAETLTTLEVSALCDYLPQCDKEPVVERLAIVFGQRMNKKIYEQLLFGWQKFPTQKNLLKVLAENDVDKYRSEHVKIPVGRFKKWYSIVTDPEKYFEDVIYCVFKIDQSVTSLNTAFEQAGLQTGTALYMCCLSEYFTFCSMQVFMDYGDDIVDYCIQNAIRIEIRKAIIFNLLRQGAPKYGNHLNLIKFRKSYQSIYHKLRKPDKDKFGQEHQEEYETYLWWYNYRLIEEGFNHDADRRRILFWRNYLGKCSVSRLESKKFIIMDFGEYCALESETMGTLYFFKSDYFNHHVLPRLKEKSASEGKSWMKNYSQFVYRKTHAGRWEATIPSEMRKRGMI